MIAVAQRGDGLRRGVLEHRPVGTGDEARRVVDRSDRDLERLGGAGVGSAVRRAAVVERRTLTVATPEASAAGV